MGLCAGQSFCSCRYLCCLGKGTAGRNVQVPAGPGSPGSNPGGTTDNPYPVDTGTWKQIRKGARDRYLAGTFRTAVHKLASKFGNDLANWQYGQDRYKHVQIKHPLGEVVNRELQARLNTGIMPRGGDPYTPCATSGSDNQASGATFRLIVDVNDWDSAVGTNTPGQSGDPDSRFYKNLIVPWAMDEYFPVYFSRGKIASAAVEKTRLMPLK